ncbi:MAG: hypothetical protein UC708_03475 [Anaerovoracaceae bacterium]|nr:hypothetical protein [Anaerovoracaceae bacterium]
MKKLKKLAMKNTAAAYIYFTGMTIAAAMPMITVYLLLYLIAE